jgi:hypothetical protein
VVLCGAHKNHDSPALPEVLAQFYRSGVTRHLDPPMDYRILSQNSSPTPSAMRPVTRPEPRFPASLGTPDWLPLGRSDDCDATIFVGGTGVGVSHPPVVVV